MKKLRLLLFFLVLFLGDTPANAAKKRSGQGGHVSFSSARPRQMGHFSQKMQHQPARQQRIRQQKSAMQSPIAPSFMQGTSARSGQRRQGFRAQKQFFGSRNRQKHSKGASFFGGNKKSSSSSFSQRKSKGFLQSSSKHERIFSPKDRSNRKASKRERSLLNHSKKIKNNRNSSLNRKTSKRENALHKRESGSKKESRKNRRERKQERKEQRKQKKEARRSGRVQANSSRAQAAAHVAQAAKESPTAGLLDAGTSASASRIIPLAVDAHVGLGIATTPAGTAVGIYTGGSFGWFASPQFYGSGWGWQSPFWGPCHWYPRIGFWRVYGGACWYNPWLGACLFPWDAMLISQGMWPAWVFPWYGCTFYSIPSYSGCVVRVDSGLSSGLYCSVYYREPGSRFLIRYIEPRVIDGEVVKVVVPVRKDRYERVVVISQDESSFKDSLPEKPDEDANYRYVMLNDPEDAEQADDPEKIEFEALSDAELEKIKATNKAIDEKMDGKNFKELKELRDLDLSDEDLESEK